MATEIAENSPTMESLEDPPTETAQLKIDLIKKVSSFSISEDNKEKETDKSPKARKARAPSTPRKTPTPCWLSCELRLDDFSIKKQSFEITGWINVFWIWDKAPAKLKNFEGRDPDNDDADDDDRQSEMITYKNGERQDIVKVIDLRYV